MTHILLFVGLGLVVLAGLSKHLHAKAVNTAVQDIMDEIARREPERLRQKLPDDTERE